MHPRQECGRSEITASGTCVKAYPRTRELGRFRKTIWTLGKQIRHIRRSVRSRLRVSIIILLSHAYCTDHEEFGCHGIPRTAMRDKGRQSRETESMVQVMCVCACVCIYVYKWYACVCKLGVRPVGPVRAALYKHVRVIRAQVRGVPWRSVLTTGSFGKFNYLVE